MHRHDLAEFAARGAAGPPANVLDQIKSPRMDVGRGLGAHPAHDFLWIRQEGEHGGGRRRDLGLAPGDERFIHFSSLLKKLIPTRDAALAAKRTCLGSRSASRPCKPLSGGALRRYMGEPRSK